MQVLIASMALDTNAQNYRYAEAAKRWGSDRDVLKALIAGWYDPADVGGRYREAAKKIGTLAIRSAHVAEAYFAFPHDIRWNRTTHHEVQVLANEADVIHLNNSHRAYFKLRQAQIRKPALLHHHGTLFRNDPETLLTEAKRCNMVQAVSTIDLQRPAPDLLHWLPTAYDMDMLAKIGAENRRTPDGLVRVVSAPTNPEYKSTEKLKAAVARLQAEGLPVELVLVTSRPWAECLAIKATADIYFDQVAVSKLPSGGSYPGGYGCNAIEAWGMGIPVIAGADEWTLDRMAIEYAGPIPFYTATEDTIADSLRAMVKSKALRKKWADIGMAHVQKFHAEKPALARLAELYGMAIKAQRDAPVPYEGEFPLRSGTFSTEFRSSLIVPIGNQTVRFNEGRVTIEDPRTAQRMRQIARFRPRFKISEVVA